METALPVAMATGLLTRARTARLDYTIRTRNDAEADALEAAIDRLAQSGRSIMRITTSGVHVVSGNVVGNKAEAVLRPLRRDGILQQHPPLGTRFPTG